MLLALILVPAVAGAFALLAPSARLRWLLLAGTAAVQAALVAAAVARTPAPLFGGWLALDPLGLVFLGILAVLFLLVVLYLGIPRDPGASRPERTFSACLLWFLASMTLVTISQHLALLWAAIEATTLASAPLIYHHQSRRSLEAAWKYLLICSVGIALALMGTFLLALSASGGAVEQEDPLLFVRLLAAAGSLDPDVLRAAFVFLLVGYGTKMGLAPLHTWLPDAHSEAPSPVSALLSGALLNCAFLGVLRGWQVIAAAGLSSFGARWLIVFGLVSIGLAGALILGQRDYKRMLAYSSVEHMGILAVGVGLGGIGQFGAMLHAVNHSLAKGLLFLTAGNLLVAYGTKSSRDVRGVLRALPASGTLWVVGFLAIAGMPPFGLFLSEVTILKSALDAGRFGVAAAFLAPLALVFAGMSAVVLRMAQGEPADVPPQRERLEAVLSPALLALALLVLGLYVPPGLERLLEDAAALLGGAP
ncbi:MAG TPA: proton-conducting transporter membrane subunit [Longimicrobiales bacterium]